MLGRTLGRRFDPRRNGPRGLVGWWDACDFDPNGNPADGATLSTSTPWRDKSGTGLDMGLTAMSGVTYVRDGRNGLPVVRFAGGGSGKVMATNDAAKVPWALGTLDIVIYAAAKRTGGSGRGVLVSMRNNSGGGFSWGWETGTTDMRFYNVGGTVPGSYSVDAGWHNWQMTTGTSSGWANWPATEDAGPALTGGDAGGYANNPYLLFGAEDYTVYDSNLTGDVGEILIYAGPEPSGTHARHDKGDINMIVGYLTAKWGHD